ncbi:hypothetical protein K227x_21870 [Rubripirellula lacrimiformis]|uniref:Mce/MlaD domain-containing protein n=1 Tax=Rubripirellula lacrimiformis TaxID=1930273 RepID=A0A517N9J5_9BACT|nr:MlaD family protein [Rubripirellula lacrimiformis]QDT03802.1 hypothetical protein K227x_21870 [Rubripirellula lacrimiformis]
MDENKLKFGVGVLVISSIGVGIILTFLFGAFPSVFNNDYSLQVVFQSAEGIGLNTAVYRDGVPIGRVSDIKLRDEGGVLVSLAMRSDQRLSHRYIPRIGSGNLVTGDSKLEFVRINDPRQLPKQIRGDEKLLDAPFTDDEFIDYGRKTPGLFEMQDGVQSSVDAIQLAAQSIATAGESVNQLAMEVRQVVGGTDGRIDAVAKDAQLALQEFQGAIVDARKIIGNPETRANLEASMAELPILLQDARAALETTKTTFESFERVGNQFEKVGHVAEETVNTAKDTVEGARGVIGNAEKTFANLEKFTEPLADRGDELVAQVLQTLSSVERTLMQVEQFGESLNNSNGSVKRFLDDDELYYQVRRTVENIEMATARIRPIMDDVRVFTDKIARDPRELGVRGALTKRPSGAGLK